MRSFSAYAAPMLYGPLVEIGSHLGKISFTISYSAVGDTQVLAKVHYYKESDPGVKTVESIASGATIRTADVVANVEIQFQGSPTGSSVIGSISP